MLHNKSKDRLGGGGSAFADDDLGSVLRGQRARMGKSLIDVQNEIGLRPHIIGAIENADVRTFTNPGLIGGYVRQYARYLDMDPDDVYAWFCDLTGHIGHPAVTGKNRLKARAWHQKSSPSDTVWQLNWPSLARLLFSNISMLGVVTASSLVIFLAVAGYASLTLYNYFKILPVSNATLQIARIEIADPDAGVMPPDASSAPAGAPLGAAGLRAVKPLAAIGDLQPAEWVEEKEVLIASTNFGPRLNDSSRTAPLSLEEGDRGYHPLDVANDGFDLLPVLQAMNPPADTVLPDEVFVPKAEVVPPGKVVLHPVAPAWVQIKDTSGTVYFEGILDKDEQYAVPSADQDLYLRSGMSGFVYLLVDQEIYGPVGTGTQVAKQIPLTSEMIAEVYAERNLGSDPSVLETLN